MVAKVLRTLGGAYVAVSVSFCTVVLVFVLANAAGWAYQKYKTLPWAMDPRLLPNEGPDFVRDEIYPNLSPHEAWVMVTESWAIGYEYAPYRQFQVKSTQGKYTSNSPAGFRHCKDQGPWPPQPENFNVFLFGGSTAYNMGVPEDDTIASHLQDALRGRLGRKVCVYNFGCPMFFSSPEAVLFDRLLVQGFKPDVAVFLDGLNEYYHVEDEPGFTNQLKVLFENNLSATFHLRAVFDSLPAVSMLRSRFFHGALAPAPGPRGEAAEGALLEEIRNRYLRNLKSIEAAAGAYGVKTLFVWQPVPQYKYHGFHPYPPQGFGLHGRAVYGYPAMAKYVEKNPMPGNFLWLADMQEGLEGMLYVDIVHYTGRLSRLIAVRMADALCERGMVQ